jgi:hypothetical protein
MQRSAGRPAALTDPHTNPQPVELAQLGRSDRVDHVGLQHAYLPRLSVPGGTVDHSDPLPRQQRPGSRRVQDRSR